jgi:hypothetical protein
MVVNDVVKAGKVILVAILKVDPVLNGSEIVPQMNES